MKHLPDSHDYTHLGWRLLFETWPKIVLYFINLEDQIVDLNGQSLNLNLGKVKLRKLEYKKLSIQLGQGVK